MVEFIDELDLKKGDTPWHYQRRKQMIERQIRARGVRDPVMLGALEKVPRHRFVEEGLEGSAYEDTPLPLIEGQTISQPFIVAYMTAAVKPHPEARVLEVGTGSGYQAAVLGEIVAEVYTVEIMANLAIDSAQRLKRMGYENVHVRFGDGYKGWPEAGPFDGIVVTAAPDHIPQPLVDQLKEGGRMVIPVGEKSQELLVVIKQPDGSTKTESRIPVRFVPMLGEAGNRD